MNFARLICLQFRMYQGLSFKVLELRMNMLSDIFFDGPWGVSYSSLDCQNELDEEFDELSYDSLMFHPVVIA